MKARHRHKEIKPRIFANEHEESLLMDSKLYLVCKFSQRRIGTARPVALLETS
jgi:hypothetical protein